MVTFKIESSDFFLIKILGALQGGQIILRVVIEFVAPINSFSSLAFTP